MPRKRKIYTNEELIGQVLRLADELGRPPYMTEFSRSPDTASFYSVTLAFGSWNNFLEAAGLPIYTKKIYSDEELLEQVRQYAAQLGRVPKQKEFNLNPDMPSFSVIVKRFGSWNEFLEKAGLEVPHKSYSREEIIEEIQALANRLGRTPTLDDFHTDPDTNASWQAVHRFGTWNEALEAAGLKPNVDRRNSGEKKR